MYKSYRAKSSIDACRTQSGVFVSVLASFPTSWVVGDDQLSFIPRAICRALLRLDHAISGWGVELLAVPERWINLHAAREDPSLAVILMSS
jgi:hypothetical protein